MKTEINLGFHVDDSNTSFKVIVYMLSIATLILSVFFCSHFVTVLIILGIIIIRKLFSKPDGSLKITYVDQVLLLDAIFKKDNLYQQLEIGSLDYSWHYRFDKQAGANSFHSNAGHTNYIQLKLEIHLKDNAKIVLYEELYPWQETPANLKYKPFVAEYFDHCLLLNRSLNKLVQEMKQKNMIKY